MYNKWLVFFLSASDQIEIYSKTKKESTQTSSSYQSKEKQKTTKSWTEVYDSTLDKNINIMKIEGNQPAKWSVLLYPPIINDIRKELKLIDTKIKSYSYEI